MMKTRLSRTLSLLSLTLALFVSCQNNFFEPVESLADGNESGDKVDVSINVSAPSRTALPDLDWTTFEYMLSAEKSDDGTTYGESTNIYAARKDYSDLATKFSLDRAYYRFTLKGYHENGTDPVIIGKVEKDLTAKGDTLSFIMQAAAVTGETGSAQVVLRVPKSVASVKDCTTTTRTPGTLRTLSTTNWALADDYKSYTYAYNSLPSGTKQYAYFELYNAAGSRVYSFYDSLVIVAGETSKDTCVITSDALHTYSVSITLQKGTTNWTDSKKELVLVDNSTSPAKTYVLTDTDKDGAFTGTDIPEGNYDIYIRNAGDQTTISDTGLNYDSSAEKITRPTSTGYTTVASVKFNEVTIPTPDNLIFTPTIPMPNAIPSSDSGKILIIDGSVAPIEFTVELKPGYKPGNDGISVNGIQILDEKGDPTSADTNTDKSGAQIELTPDQISSVQASGTEVKIYTVTFTLGSAIGAKWSDSAGGGTDAKQYTYTVVNYSVTFPGNSDITPPEGNKFAGWKVPGTNTAVTSIPEGTIGDLTYEPLWIALADVDYKILILKEKVNSYKYSSDADKYEEDQTVTKHGYATYTPVVDASYKADIAGFLSAVVTCNNDGKIAEDGSTVVTIKYSRKQVTLTFNVPDGTLDGAATKTYIGNYGDTLTVSSPVHGTPKADYYNFKRWVKTGTTDTATVPSTFPDPDSETTVKSFTAEWTKAYADYKIEYWFEKVSYTNDSDRYEINPGWADKTVSKVALPANVSVSYPSGKTGAPEGFTLVTTGSVSVNENDSTVLKAYFDRKTVTVTYTLDVKYTGNNTIKSGAFINTSESSLSQVTRTGKFGTTIPDSPTVTTNTDYFTADGWKKTSDNTAVQNLPTEFPSSNEAYTYTWTQVKAPYKIEYYKQDVANTTVYDKLSSDEVTALGLNSIGNGSLGDQTAVTAPSASNIPTGYKARTNTPVVNTTITADGNATVKVYFDAMTITYNYVLDGGNWPATETRNGVRSGLYGTAVEVPTAVPTKDDCQFDGWDYDATTFDLYNGNATRTITAKWKSVASGDLEADITWTGEIKFTSDQKNKTLTAQKPSDVGTWVFKWYYNKYGEGDGAYTGPSTGETFSYSSFDAGCYSVLLIGEHTINGITTPYTTTIGMTIE